VARCFLLSPFPFVRITEKRSDTSSVSARPLLGNDACASDFRLEVIPNTHQLTRRDRSCGQYDARRRTRIGHPAQPTKSPADPLPRQRWFTLRKQGGRVFSLSTSETEITLEEAKKRGLEPCGRCAPPE
jgi:hypothetical protein